MRISSVLLVGGLVLAACGGRADNGAAADAIPAVDRAVHSVPLDEVIFDTFDGGSVSLDQASPATVRRLLDAIVPIDDPRYEPARGVDWLAPDDVVLSYVDDDGDAWAYPTRVLDLHEIVNDELADRPLVITYCPLCASGIVYDRRVEGVVLRFSNTSALHENDMVMVDRSSGSYWWQVAGEAIVGSRTGDRLDPLPSEMVRFGDWVVRHPDGQVLSRPSGRDYSQDFFAGYPDRVDAGVTPFPVSDAALADDRLPSGASVLVVEWQEQTWAWAVDPPAVLDTVVGDTPVRVETDGTGGSITRRDTNERLPTRTALWFSVVSAFPDVELQPAR